jgi:hypothetical protein
MAIQNVDIQALSQGVQKRVTEFLMDLADEGERSAVVLGAARLDLALERVVKKVTTHHPGGSDNLFDPDRPLGTFAAKIALTFRLGLIGQDMERALQLVRRIRNEFAHAAEKASLSESMHRSRVLELGKLGRQHAGNSFDELHSLFKGSSNNEVLAAFVTTVALMLISLEVVEGISEYVRPPFVADIETKVS